MSEPLIKITPPIQYGINTRSRGLQRVALQTISPFNQQDALHFGQGAECIWVLHYCCILYRIVDSTLSASHPPASARQH